MPKKSTDQTDPEKGGLAVKYAAERKGQTPYSEDLAIQICSWISSGKSLRSFCMQTDGSQYADKPTRESVYNWLARVPEFAELYRQARLDRADSIADEVLDVAFDQSLDPASRRVMVDAMKWMAAKLYPKNYGDRVAVTGAKDGDPIRVERSAADLSDEELAAIALRRRLEGG